MDSEIETSMVGDKHGRMVDGVQWTLGLNRVEAGGRSYGKWTNPHNSRVLCDLCNVTCARIQELKRHYISVHPQGRDDSAGVGPVRRRQLSPRVNTSRLPSTPHTPLVSSPLARAPPSLPDTSPKGVDDGFTDAVDEALEHLAIDPQPSSSQNHVGTKTTPTASPHPSFSTDIRTPLSYPAYRVTEQWTVLTPEPLQHTSLKVIGEFKALVCIECRMCIPPDMAPGHLKTKHKYKNLSDLDVNRIVQEYGLETTAEAAVKAVKQTRRFSQCPLLAQHEGWWCEACGYATLSKQKADQHRRLPDHFREEDTIRVNGERHRRPRSVVAGTIQTLFALNQGGYIPSIPSSSSASMPSASDLFSQIVSLEKDLYAPSLIPHADPRSVHPFIEISGFRRWIGEAQWSAIESLQAKWNLDEAPWGKLLLNHCREMLECSFSLCVPQNYTACCHVNSPTTVIETLPFGEIISESAQMRYSRTWAQLITFLINTVDLPDGERLYGLTPKQYEQVVLYRDLLEKEDDSSVAVEALTFLSAALFCHQLGRESVSDHPIIAFTILFNTKPGNVIANPVHISPFLASLEYFCRTTMMVYSHIMTLSYPEEFTFYEAVRELSVWLKEGENTAFAWIRQMLHLTAKFVHGTNQMPRFVWGLDDGRSYTFDGYRVQVQHFCGMVKGAVQETISSFFKLWDRYGIPRSLLLTSLDDIGDALGSRSTNYNFTRHPSNVRLQNLAQECQDVAINSGKFCQVVPGVDELLFHPHAIQEALSESEAFLQCLVAACYLGSGQPPRGSELMSTLLVNTDTRIRNFFITNGAAILSHFLNKTTFALNSDKAIVRELCSALSLVIANYVALLRPLEIKFYKRVGGSGDDLERMRRYLFQMGSHRFETPVLTARLQTLWRKYVTGFPPSFKGWGTAETRHHMIFIGRRFIRPSALGNDGDALLDLQAGHSSQTARIWYAVEANQLTGDIDSETLWRFCLLSQGHHGCFDLITLTFDDNNLAVEPIGLIPPEELPPPSTPELHLGTRPDDTPVASPQAHSLTRILLPTLPPPKLPSLPPTSDMPANPALPPAYEDVWITRFGSMIADSVVKAVGRSLSPAPPARPSTSNSPNLEGFSTPAASPSSNMPKLVEPVVFDAMRKLMPDGRFRSPEQAMAAQLAWENQTHVLAVLPTGGGKTLIAQVAAMLDRMESRVNIILVPLKSLADDLTERLSKSDIMVERFRGRDTPFAQVVIAIFEDAGKPHFSEYIRTRIETKTMGRLIVDECHYPVYAGDFRPGMASLSTLVIHGIQLVLLSATVPVTETRKVLDFYGTPRASIVRAPTSRPNIKYVVEKLPSRPSGLSEVTFAYQQIKKAIATHRPASGSRVLIYIMSKQLIDALIEEQAMEAASTGEARWSKYHADMTDSEKDISLSKWCQIMLATDALGLGTDLQRCWMVLHYEAPFTILDYVQQTGRAGRDGEPSVAVLLWSRRMVVASSLDHGRVLMSSLLESTLCRRWIISGFMDGGGPSCLSLPESYGLCDNCTLALQEYKRKNKVPPPPNNAGLEITRITTLPDQPSPDAQMRKLWPILTGLREVCLRCYMEGMPHPSHSLQMWNHPDGKYLREQLQLYIEWRRSFKTPSGYAAHLCSMCWLPSHGERYHRPASLSDKPGKSCKYNDILRPLAYAAFAREEILAEFSAFQQCDPWSTREEWKNWLLGINKVQNPRLYDFVIWFDERQSTIPGNWTARGRSGEPYN